MSSSHINPEVNCKPLISVYRQFLTNPVVHIEWRSQCRDSTQDPQEIVQISCVVRWKWVHFMSRSQLGPWPPSFQQRAWGCAQTGSLEETGPGSHGFCEAPLEHGSSQFGPSQVSTGTAPVRTCSSPGMKEGSEIPAAKHTHVLQILFLFCSGLSQITLLAIIWTEMTVRKTLTHLCRNLFSSATIIYLFLISHRQLFIKCFQVKWCGHRPPNKSNLLSIELQSF